QPKPVLRKIEGPGCSVIHARHADPGFEESLGDYYLYGEGTPPLLFTENETNNERLFGGSHSSPHVKDGIKHYVVSGKQDAVNPGQTGTKAAAHYRLSVDAGATAMLRLRLSNLAPAAVGSPFGAEFAEAMAARQREADQFYQDITPARVDDDSA